MVPEQILWGFLANNLDFVIFFGDLYATLFGSSTVMSMVKSLAYLIIFPQSQPWGYLTVHYLGFPLTTIPLSTNWVSHCQLLGYPIITTTMPTTHCPEIPCHISIPPSEK